MRLRTIILAVVLATFAAVLLTCKPSTPPTGASVICIGGLGRSQLDAMCAETGAVSAGDWDAYKSDVVPMLGNGKRVLIAHSFGIVAALKAASATRIDLIIAIDPVGTSWESELQPPPCNIVVFKRSQSFGPPVAKIGDIEPMEIAGTSHNNLPNNADLIAQVKSML